MWNDIESECREWESAYSEIREKDNEMEKSHGAEFFVNFFFFECECVRLLVGLLGYIGAKREREREGRELWRSLDLLAKQDNL